MKRAGPCVIEGCDGVGNRRGLCNRHRMRMRQHGDPLTVMNRPAGSGSIRTDGYLMHETGGRAVLEHVLIAERAIGKPLPRRAQVHHVDEDRGNNKPSNLVICESSAYHQLLHLRTRALRACGHADWRRCHVCKEYDAPGSLKIYKASGLVTHATCYRKRYGRKRVAVHV